MKKYASKTRTVAFLLMFLIVFSLTLPFSAQSTKKTVKVGYFPLTGFNEYDEFGVPCGYNVDYLNKISELTGWHYEFVKAESWVDALAMFENGETDILAPSQMTEERQAKFDFSALPIGMEYGSVLTLDSNESLFFEDFEMFNKIKFGIVKTFVFKDRFFEYAEKSGFTPNVTYYSDTNALLSALRQGEVDAVVANLMVKTSTMKVLSRFAFSPYYYMIQKDRYDLSEELNVALNTIRINTPTFENTLTAHYFSSITNTPLTKSEQQYINTLPALNVACVTGREPVSYVDAKTGEFAGITRDILDKIAANTGLKFNYVLLSDGAIGVDYLRENNIDLLSSVVQNSMNASTEILSLSSSYYSAQKVFVINKGTEFDVESPLRLAVERGSQTEPLVIASQYPKFKLVFFDSTTDCFNALKNGEADLVLQDQYVVAPYLPRPQYSNCQLVPAEQVSEFLCLSPVLLADENGSVSSALSDSRLISIINKGIQKITKDEMSAVIISNSEKTAYKASFGDFLYTYKYFIIAFFVLISIGLFIILYALSIKRRTIKAISQSEKKLSTITNNINGGVIVLLPNEGLKITYANDGFLDLLQCTREEFEQQSNKSYITNVHEDDIARLNELVEKNVADGTKISLRLRVLRKDGSYLPTLFNGTASTSIDGTVEMYCVIMDISEQVHMMEKLEIEQKRYELIMEKSEEMIYEVDLDENRISVSKIFEKKFGWTFPAEFKREGRSKILRMWHIFEDDKDVLDNLVEQTIQTGEQTDAEVRILTSAGGYIWCRISQYPMFSAGRMKSIVGRIVDIDAEMREREALMLKSRTDGLTGLLNKSAFCEICEKYFEDEPQGNSVVIFLDLDHFKNVNDTLGHIVGDTAICEAARKLQVIFSNYDAISRFGGDEFCVLVRNIPRTTIVEKLKWAVEKLHEAYSENGKTVYVTASIGAVCSEKIGNNFKDLLDAADKALYQAKNLGRNRFVIFDDNYTEDTK